MPTFIGAGLLDPRKRVLSTVTVYPVSASPSSTSSIITTTSSQDILTQPIPTTNGIWFPSTPSGPAASTVTELVSQTPGSLTIVKSTLITSTISYPPPSPTTTSTPAATSPAAASHGSQTPITPIAVPVAVGTITFLFVAFILIWRCTKPNSYKKYRGKLNAWYQDKCDRCYFHNIGWGVRATLTNWKETRQKNLSVRAQRKASSSISESGTYTGDMAERMTKPDNGLQKWRKERERQLDMARERRSRAERQDLEGLGEREVRGLRDEHLSERIAKREWERVRRENALAAATSMTMTAAAEEETWWRPDPAVGEGEGMVKSPKSDGGTTLARSRSRDSDESSWRRHWRSMGEDNDGGGGGGGGGQADVHPSLRDGGAAGGVSRSAP